MGTAAGGGGGAKGRARVSGERPMGTIRCIHQCTADGMPPPPPGARTPCRRVSKGRAHGSPFEGAGDGPERGARTPLPSRPRCRFAAPADALPSPPSLGSPPRQTSSCVRPLP